MKGERRSLLKGAMAAPFVLTVGPAAAQANASSIMCLKRDAARAAEREHPGLECRGRGRLDEGARAFPVELWQGLTRTESSRQALPGTRPVHLLAAR